MRDTYIGPHESASLVRQLREVHAGIVRGVATLSLDDWTQRPHADSWSPAEVVEHTLLVERGLLTTVEEHLQDLPLNDWESETAGKEEALRKFLPSAGKAIASQKNSTFQGLSIEVVKPLFQTTFENFSALVSRASELPLRAICWSHGAFGQLSAYQWLLYIPLHSERHLRQLKAMSE